MSERKLPYMKLWVGDWLSSQAVIEMSPMAEYLYFRLIMWSWQAKGKGLKSTLKHLSQMCRVDEETFKEYWPEVMMHFTEKNGRVYHHKVEEQMSQQKEISEKRAAAGRIGGKAKAPFVDKQTSNQRRKQNPNTPLMAMAIDESSSSSSSKEEERMNVREESKKLRDHYLKKVSLTDQTRTQALPMIDMMIQEELYMPAELKTAIERYGLEFKASGSTKAISCKKFFSERLYAEFLREDWTEPEEGEEVADREAPRSFLETQEEKDAAEFDRLMLKRREEEEQEAEREALEGA